MARPPTSPERLQDPSPERAREPAGAQLSPLVTQHLGRLRPVSDQRRWPTIVGYLRCSRRGFTLIEVMVVISIIGLLATIVSISVSDSDYQARVSRAKADFHSIQQASNLFKLEHGRHARDLQELVSPPPGKTGAPEQFLPGFPKDPWGTPYAYERTGRNLEITSFGADGAPGGRDEDRDLLASELLAE